MVNASQARPARLLALLLALLAAPLAWSGDAPRVQEQQGISFVSGGLGQDARARLQAMEGEFNLKLVFALDAGQYLSGIRVRIANQSQDTLLDTTTDGPILLVRMPAGQYVVTASKGQDSKRRELSVDRRETTQLTVTWPAE